MLLLCSVYVHTIHQSQDKEILLMHVIHMREYHTVADLGCMVGGFDCLELMRLRLRRNAWHTLFAIDSDFSIYQYHIHVL